MEKPTVRILLATYNGREYICQLLESLLAQDYQNMYIIASDDGSQDGTSAVLAEYAAEYPDKISHYRSGLCFGSAQKHFMHLLEHFQDAPYIMFCDQDDIWHSDKVSKTLEMMLQTEKDSNVPTLVHTDLRVVDQELNEISPSFCAHSKLDGNRLEFRQLLVQNVVTGCTVMINRSLAEIACENYVTDKMLMHDWWLSLLASACGRIAFLREPTIDYRQHSSNAVGAKDVHSAGYLLDRLRTGESRKSLVRAAYQAQAFLDCYGDRMMPNYKEIAGAFASTADAPLLTRDRIYVKYKILKRGIPRITAQLLGL